MSTETEVKLSEELKEAGEPLLPVEKKLVGWSIAIGVVLLVVLIFVSYRITP